MRTGHAIILLAICVILAFPLAILISSLAGFLIIRIEKMKLYLWLKKRSLREGKKITKWVRPDVRRDILILDLSRLSENLVGVKQRTYNVLRRKEPPPDFGELEYIKLEIL